MGDHQCHLLVRPAAGAWVKCARSAAQHRRRGVLVMWTLRPGTTYPRWPNQGRTAGRPPRRSRTRCSSRPAPPAAAAATPAAHAVSVKIYGVFLCMSALAVKECCIAHNTLNEGCDMGNGTDLS